MERYGIPQARHRVILLGVREDLPMEGLDVLKPEKAVVVQQSIRNLPGLRSGISRESDSARKWLTVLRSMRREDWFAEADYRLNGTLKTYLSDIHGYDDDRGEEFVWGKWKRMKNNDWLADSKLQGFVNHSTRGHMRSDLYRYFFAACHAKQFGRSPLLAEFPEELLPNHMSVKKSLAQSSYFADRFRVQLGNRPSTTIMSHISKDGHYYIHPDPLQCRSLTVREAARLQTFPDNYFFCGPRTAQYIQVGNAVPPYLAYQIAEVVRDLIS